VECVLTFAKVGKLPLWDLNMWNCAYVQKFEK